MWKEPSGSGSRAYKLYRAAWACLDWVFPPVCGGCGKLGLRWCLECQQNQIFIPAQICSRCGEPTSTGVNCQRCLRTPPLYEALRSLAVFDGPIRNALHRLKYEGDVALGEVLARPLICLLQELNWQVDMITPVPIGVARLAERGYNQAAKLAWPIALFFRTPYRSNALFKVRNTATQVGLTIEQRRQNVSGAFEADPQWVAGRRVLIVDDVTTTGATLDACTQALLSAGANQVFGLTLARAA